MNLTSSLFGPFDPRAPREIDGLFAFTIAVEPIVIDASATAVWEILVDFARYPEWNPLNRFLRLDTDATVNARITLGYTFRPLRESGELPDHDATRRERLTVWEPNVCLSYADVGFGFANERTQYVHPEGGSRCSYFTYERFSGGLAPLIRAVYGRRIRAAFQRAGWALKARAERR